MNYLGRLACSNGRLLQVLPKDLGGSKRDEGEPANSVTSIRGAEVRAAVEKLGKQMAGSPFRR